MMADWRIQGGEIDTKRSRPVAMRTVAKNSDDAGKTRRLQYGCAVLHVDHTQLLDHTTDVDRQDELEKEKKLSEAATEITVSFVYGEGISHFQLNCT